MSVQGKSKINHPLKKNHLKKTKPNAPQKIQNRPPKKQTNQTKKAFSISLRCRSRN